MYKMCRQKSFTLCRSFRRRTCAKTIMTIACKSIRFVSFWIFCSTASAVIRHPKSVAGTAESVGSGETISEIGPSDSGDAISDANFECPRSGAKTAKNFRISNGESFLGGPKRKYQSRNDENVLFVSKARRHPVRSRFALINVSRGVFVN